MLVIEVKKCDSAGLKYNSKVSKDDRVSANKEFKSMINP